MTNDLAAIAATALSDFVGNVPNHQKRRTYALVGDVAARALPADDVPCRCKPVQCLASRHAAHTELLAQFILRRRAIARLPLAVTNAPPGEIHDLLELGPG